MSEIPHLLVHEQADNVGVVVVEGLTAGTDMLCCITHDNSTFRLTAKHDVPIGHKIALKDLKTGDTCMKYGEDIGKIVADVARQRAPAHPQLQTKRWADRKSWHRNIQTSLSMATGARTAASACATTC